MQRTNKCCDNCFGLSAAKEIMKHCPVCKMRRTIQTQKVYGGAIVTVDDYLYQYSYPGEPGYISPRCAICLDKAMKRSRADECN